MMIFSLLFVIIWLDIIMNDGEYIVKWIIREKKEKSRMFKIGSVCITIISVLGLVIAFVGSDLQKNIFPAKLDLELTDDVISTNLCYDEKYAECSFLMFPKEEFGNDSSLYRIDSNTNKFIYDYDHNIKLDPSYTKIEEIKVFYTNENGDIYNFSVGSSKETNYTSLFENGMYSSTIATVLSEDNKRKYSSNSEQDIEDKRVISSKCGRDCYIGLEFQTAYIETDTVLPIFNYLVMQVEYGDGNFEDYIMFYLQNDNIGDDTYLYTNNEIVTFSSYLFPVLPGDVQLYMYPIDEFTNKKLDRIFLDDRYIATRSKDVCQNSTISMNEVELKSYCNYFVEDKVDLKKIDNLYKEIELVKSELEK
ncbi:MAG: hypothetical protein ACK5K7_07530 [Bacilli bacterium]